MLEGGARAFEELLSAAVLELNGIDSVELARIGEADEKGSEIDCKPKLCNVEEEAVDFVGILEFELATVP